MNSKKPAKPRGRHEVFKTPNIYDVAREAHVSVYTVSSVVNRSIHVSDELRQRVEEAIQRLSYRPNLLARGLAKRQTNTIGMIVPDIGNPFYPHLVRGAEDTAQEGGYSILLCNSDNQPDKEERYLDLLLSKQVDGILLTKAPGPFSLLLRRMLAKSRVPLVLLSRTRPELKVDAVVADDLRGAYEAVTHLARAGHRRIGWLGGPLNMSHTVARFDGYLKGLKKGGLRRNPELVEQGDFQIESGYRGGLAILSQRPDAVIASNFLMTVGLMQAADELGMECPSDFGLISFDDFPWLRYFRPRLTTIDVPKYEIGAAGAQKLLLRLAGKNGPHSVVKLKPKLTVRESCGFAMRAGGKREPPGK
ncbi:MAG: LacI family DNA-binding transcriptional regulator [Terriglobia bacterium]